MSGIFERLFPRNWAVEEVSRQEADRMAYLNRPLKVLPTTKVRIRALTSSFCVSGRCVQVGEVFDLDQDIARGLVHLGKAELL